MACNYYYKGNFVGNELQLADFLLTKEKYYSDFGDIVFDLTLRATETLNKLEGEIRIAGEKANQKLLDYVAKHGVDYNEDGLQINLEKPAMGVNKFLGKFKHTEGPKKGRQLMPEFREKEYWDRKKQDWSRGMFTEDDLELIKEVEGNPDFDFEQTHTPQNLDKWAKAILAKWTAQGETGSALHAISELFFGKDSDGKYNFEALEGNPALLKDWFDNHFKDETDKFGKIKYGNYVNFNLFSLMVEMCQNLKRQLIEKYGENCRFYPEFTVSSKITADPSDYDGCNELIGIIDLLVVDDKGRTHIFDYKTSPKTYAQYSSAKERGFTYLLATYDRILQHYGIYTGDGSLNIIPIKLDNFKFDGTLNRYTFDSVSYEINAGSGVVDVHRLETKADERIQRTLDEFIPSEVKLEIYSENLLEKTSKQIAQWCPTYQLLRNMDDELLREMINKAGGFTPNKEGKLVYKFRHGYGQEIEVDTTEHANPEAEMFRLVKKEINSWTEKKRLMAESFKDAFEEAVANGGHFEFKKAEVGKGNLNSNYLTEIMKQYCDGSYDLLDDPAAMCLGMLYLQNKENKTVTVLKLTGAQLDWQHEFIDGNTNMNGAFASDIEEDSKGDSLMLKATNANIEAMEAMLVLQNSNYSYDFNINEIKVINPRTLTGQPVSNKELLYTFKNLISHKNVLGEDVNKYNATKTDGPKIKMLTEAERLREEFVDILSRNSYGSKGQEFNAEIRPDMQNLINLDWSVKNREVLYDSLLQLSKKLEKAYPNSLKAVQRNLTDIMAPENRLYTSIMTTMMELKGINTRQQIKDASNWLENKNIFKYGWEGLQIENAGNFKSPILNQLTKSVSNVYLKVKDAINKENVTVRRLVAALKKEKNFGWIRSNISGNLTDMYKNMTYTDSNGEFLFVKPDTLSGAERDFLEHALDVINKNRHPKEAAATLQLWKESGDERYYRVPLMSASDGSKMSTSSMLLTTKDTLKNWSPKEAMREMQEKAAGLFSDEDVKKADDPTKLYEMTNMFEGGESEYRERILSKAGSTDAFEHNIERILLAHCYAYELQALMTKEMPLMKASALALAMQGAGANTEAGNFNNLIDFIENYTKGVIKNLSIVNELLRPAQATLGKARKAASFLALAFSPLLFTYQTVEGIWKACSLMIRKPDGSDAFTPKHMWEAFKSAYTDIAHYSDKPTKCQLMNETYGLNDMDANLFTERINSDKGIWTHFTDFAFRFASRPDFYNRLTIFGAQMRADGTWDAHEVNSKGELIYHFDKDKRYAALKTEPKGSEEYKKAMSRYIAAIEQFLKEGVEVEDADGTKRLIKFGDDLPRAYSNMEAQSMKAIADGMYGYYNHENKSMMNSMFLGALATQMKTYWSAKKNQYLAPGGVKLMGHWEDYKEAVVDANGNPVKDENGNTVMEDMYYAVDEKGEIDLSKPFVRLGEEGNSGIKVLKWQGQWLEGIVSTYYKFASKWHKEGFKAAWNELYNNEDMNLRTAYRSNLKHFVIDLFFAAVVGNIFAAILEPWEEDKLKEHLKDKSDLGKAFEYSGVKLLADTLDHSFMDFNFLDSIFSPTLDWQPFAFSSLLKLASNAGEYMFSDKSFVSTLANSSALTRQIKPIIRTMNYNEE